MNTAEIVEYLTTLAGGKLDRDEGLHFGKPDQEIKKIVLCWMAEKKAIQFAAEKKADLIITHESLFYPYDIVVTGGQPDFMSWRVNQNRIRALSAAELSVIRFHGSLDIISIFNTFAAQLKLGVPVVSKGHYEKVYALQPVAYSELVQQVKAAVGMPLVRVTPGDPDRIIRRVGLAWGGMGLFVNVRYMQTLVDLGCEVLIGGETDDYAMHFATESGLDIIETSHELSENKGIELFASTLQRDLPGTDIIFFENEIPWKVV